MGNSAGKESETLRDAVHTLLELQLAGGACGGSEGREEDGEEEVWQGIFANDLDEDGFYEVCDLGQKKFLLLGARHGGGCTSFPSKGGCFVEELCTSPPKRFFINENRRF